MNPADLQGFFIINEAKGYLMVKSVLEEKGLIDAWKYTMSAKFAVVGIEVARNRAIELMNLKTENFINIVKGIRELTKDDEYTFPPGDVFEINGKKTSISFAAGMCIKEAIQHTRCLFEYLLQAINVLYLNSIIEEEKVCFKSIKNELSKTDNKRILDWCISVLDDRRFKYVNDYNNMTKHINDIGFSLSVNFEDGSIDGYINPFKKGGHEYSKENLIQVLNDSMDLGKEKFREFLEITDIFTT